MPSYPLTFPDVGVVRSSFRLVRIVSENESIFTGAQQVYQHQGEWWEGEVTFRTMRRADAALVQSFLAELRGKVGTFLYSDPDALALGTMGAGGTITVKGAGQTGNSLLVDGMTLSTNDILKAGDYFQLNSGADSTLHMATQDLNSDGSGEGTLLFEPKIKTIPADNSAVVVSNPRGVFRLSENMIGWEANQSNLYQITIPFKEAISP